MTRRRPRHNNCLACLVFLVLLIALWMAVMGVIVALAWWVMH